MTIDTSSPGSGETPAGSAPLTLPAEPNLEHLKKQAKQLLRDVRAQQGVALHAIAQFHPRPAEFSNLRDAQLVLARRYGFTDWENLRNEVDLRQLRSETPRQQAVRVVNYACLRYDGDDQDWRYARASEWLRQLPALVRSDFHCALIAADLDAVRGFLRNDPELAIRHGGPREWPALMYVTYSRVEQNRVEAVAVAKLLLEFGAPPDARSRHLSGFTPITGAVGEGERGSLACAPHPCADELVELLLDAGANPNQSQALYNTMLGRDLGKWLPIFVRRGLKAGDKANWSEEDEEPIFDFLLSQVVLQGQVELVRYLLEQGANANAVSRYHHRSAHNIAQLTGRSDIAALLAQFGAKAEPLGEADQFRMACGRQDLQVAEDLLHRHPRLLQDQGLLRDCAMVGVETCLWLVQHGFDIDTRSANGQTVLHGYALLNNPHAIKLLLQHGADPDAKEINWQATPLGMALHHRHWAVIEILLPVSNNLFDVCQVADAERAALVLARDPASIRQRSPRGNTPLHVVSQAKQEDPDLDATFATIDLLVRHGADTNALNHEQNTPAQWFRRQGMDEVADYMSERFGAKG